jgi:hypothetical protein
MLHGEARVFKPAKLYQVEFKGTTHYHGYPGHRPGLFSSHGEREGEAGVPACGSWLNAGGGGDPLTGTGVSPWNSSCAEICDGTSWLYN